MNRKQLILRWSIVATPLVALFWAAWYLIAGEVPVMATIKALPNDVKVILLYGVMFSCGLFSGLVAFMVDLMMRAPSRRAFGEASGTGSWCGKG